MAKALNDHGSSDDGDGGSSSGGDDGDNNGSLIAFRWIHFPKLFGTDFIHRCVLLLYGVCVCVCIFSVCLVQNTQPATSIYEMVQHVLNINIST